MAKEENKSEFIPEAVTIPARSRNGRLPEFIKRYKKIAVIIVIVLIGLFIVSKVFSPKDSPAPVVPNPVQLVTTPVNRSYDFTALNNQGKPISANATASSRIKLTITNAEKTAQVLVGDKSFTAKNNKLFLILNLELRNDGAVPSNIIPGDLIRLTYGGDESRKFAPDLHNNLVPVAAISTKLDRLGFVVPASEKVFKLYIGELDGKKDIITVSFGS